MTQTEVAETPPKPMSANDIAQVLLSVVVVTGTIVAMVAQTKNPTVSLIAWIVSGGAMFLRLPMQLFLERRVNLATYVLAPCGLVVAALCTLRLLNL